MRLPSTSTLVVSVMTSAVYGAFLITRPGLTGSAPKNRASPSGTGPGPGPKRPRGTAGSGAWAFAATSARIPISAFRINTSYSLLVEKPHCAGDAVRAQDHFR